VRIYFDHQSATPVLPEIVEAMIPFLSGRFGNASALHAEGFAARDALGKAREQVAAFLGAEAPEDIIFTGNGTEAVNLAIKGTAWANQRRGRHIVMSAAEHPATANSVKWLRESGFEASVVPVDAQGRIDPNAFGAALRDDTVLACIHHANHDIGTIQPVRELADIAADRGAVVFVDAIASAGWLPVNVRELGADLLAISPHRFYGPKGVGILYRHRRARIQSLIHGGEQEEGRRAGTENIPAIAGAGLACEIAGRNVAAREERTRALQARAWEGIRSRVEGLTLNGPEPGLERHPANLNISIASAEGEALGLMLDVKGIAVATGSACVTKENRIPAVLAAIGLPEALARGNVILSLGEENTPEEIDYFIDTFAEAVRKLREMSEENGQFAVK
jgi:cysteine desulfurase